MGEGHPRTLFVMRSRQAAVAAAAVVLVAAMVLLLAGVFAPGPVARPSPTPSPTATPTPTLTQTERPTANPTLPPTPTPPPVGTERPRPTTNTSGLRMHLFYPQVRALFPLLPPTIQIDLDEPAGTDGNAWFRGLNAAGQPIFAVREDFALDLGTAAHEIGHAYQKVLERSQPVHIDVLARYWSFRGFPGTWQQQQAESNAQQSASGKWIWSPIESWAEAFRAAVTLEVKERTLDHGRTIDPTAMRSFFRSLTP